MAENILKPEWHQLGNSSVVFGHLHMAKTGGSEINGALSMAYERVCGNKGYSFSAYQSNQQKSEVLKKNGAGAVKAENINVKMMKAWGYENCDYLSMETGWAGNTWKFWEEQSNRLHSIANLTMELHVPCRDPLDHFLSQCNFNRKKFDCNSPDLMKEYNKCVRPEHEARFHPDLMVLPYLNVKCFRPLPPQRYLDYMSAFLQPRRVTGPYIHGKTNEPRNKDLECLWNNAEVKAKMLELLLERDYYKFCASCLGSQDDLLRNQNSSEAPSG